MLNGHLVLQGLREKNEKNYKCPIFNLIYKEFLIFGANFIEKKLVDIVVCLAIWI